MSEFTASIELDGDNLVTRVTVPEQTVEVAGAATGRELDNLQNYIHEWRYQVEQRIERDRLGKLGRESLRAISVAYDIPLNLLEDYIKGEARAND